MLSYELQSDSVTQGSKDYVVPHHVSQRDSDDEMKLQCKLI